VLLATAATAALVSPVTAANQDHKVKAVFLATAVSLVTVENLVQAEELV
jgi:hypothetical protein